jgi:hypothetical protein
MKAKLKIFKLEYKLRHIFFVGNFEMKEIRKQDTTDELTGALTCCINGRMSRGRMYGSQ